MGQTEQTCLLKQVRLKKIKIQCTFPITQSLAQLALFTPEKKERMKHRTEGTGFMRQSAASLAPACRNAMGSGRVLLLGSRDGGRAKGITGLRGSREKSVCRCVLPAILHPCNISALPV